MFYPVGSDHILQERGASDFPRSGRGFLSAGQCQSQKEALQSARRINRRTTCKASFLNLKNTLQSGCLTLDPFPTISLRYKRHPLPSPLCYNSFPIQFLRRSARSLGRDNGGEPNHPDNSMENSPRYRLAAASKVKQSLTLDFALASPCPNYTKHGSI